MPVRGALSKPTEGPRVVNRRLNCYWYFAFSFATQEEEERGKKVRMKEHSMLNICITIPGLSLTFNIAYEL